MIATCPRFAGCKPKSIRDTCLSDLPTYDPNLYRLLSALESDAVEVSIRVNEAQLLQSAVSEFDAYAEKHLSLIAAKYQLRDFEALLHNKAVAMQGAVIPVQDAKREAACRTLSELLAVRAQITLTNEENLWQAGFKILHQLRERSDFWLKQATHQVTAMSSALGLMPHQALERNIRTLLRVSRISMSELARRSGVDRKTIYKWMSGLTSPDLEYLSAVAGAFTKELQREITVEDLRDGNLTEEAILARPLIQQSKSRTATV